MLSLSDLKAVFDVVKNLIPLFRQKGVILDFMQPFDLGLGKGPAGEGYSADCLPTRIPINLSLDAWNKDEHPNVLQKITAELYGLEDAGWTSGSGTAFEYNSTNPLQLARSLQPWEHLPIRLEISIGFEHRDAYKFVEQLRKLKNERQRIKVVYTVREGIKTKTKETKEIEINFYGAFCPGYPLYLSQCGGNETAKRLLNILEAERP